MDIYIYQQILVLEYWNLANLLGVSMQEFFVKFFFGLDLNLHLYLMVWLEIEHLHIAATTFARDFKLGTHLCWINSWIFWEFLFDLNFHLDIMVWLENGHLHISAKRLQTWYTPWEGQLEHFLQKKIWFDLNLYLYLMVWLEIGHLHTVEPYLHWGLFVIIFWLNKVNWINKSFSPCAQGG